MMELVVKRDLKPLYVREPGKPWHCLKTAGGPNACCGTSFNPVYHPRKVIEHPPVEGFTPPLDERCGRRGCREQYEVHDTLVAAIAATKAEIDAAFPAGFLTRPDLCGKTKSFVNVDDPTDVLVLRCDQKLHSGKVHRSSEKNVEWFE